MIARSKIVLIALGLAIFAAMPTNGQSMGHRFDRRYIILYEKPHFQGRSVTIGGPTPKLSSYNFNDDAQSARVRGVWLVCAAKFYQNDCITIDRDIPDLKSMKMKRRATSVRPIR